MRNAFGWLITIALAVALIAVVMPRLSPSSSPARTILPPPVAVTTAPVLVPAARSVRQVVEQTKPAVVQITTEQLKLDRGGRPARHRARDRATDA